MREYDLLSVRHGDGTCTCGACKERMRPTGGTTAFGVVASCAALAMCLAGMPMIAVLPPLNMMLIPPTFFVVASLVGGAGNHVASPMRCARCSKYLVFTAPGA